MAYESFPNNAHNNRAVSLAEHEQMAVSFTLAGLLNYTTTPPVFADSSGRQVKLRAGVAANIRGTRFNNLTETIIAIQPNTSGKTRIDLVVLRLRRTESTTGANDQYTIAPAVIQGVPSDTPAAPSVVRNDTPGAGFWDIPLCEVTVINGAALIEASRVVTRAYFITPGGGGYTGREEWGAPPVEPGVVFRANDTGITYVGTTGSGWQPTYYDTGWVNITNGISTPGWELRNFAVCRSGNVVTMIMYIARTGAALGASAHQYFGPVASHFRPNRNAYGAAHVGSPDHSTYVIAETDGTITLAGNGSEGINTGAQILANLTWNAGPRNGPIPR